MQSEGLVSSFGCVGFVLQFAPGVIIREPNQVAFAISHLTRNADLVAVEVVDLLSTFAVFGCPIADRYEGFVAVGIDVDIGMFAVRVDFLQQMAAVSNETGLVFEVVPA